MTFGDKTSHRLVNRGPEMSQTCHSCKKTQIAMPSSVKYVFDQNLSMIYFVDVIYMDTFVYTAILMYINHHDTSSLGRLSTPDPQGHISGHKQASEWGTMTPVGARRKKKQRTPKFNYFLGWLLNQFNFNSCSKQNKVLQSKTQKALISKFNVKCWQN